MIERTDWIHSTHQPLVINSLLQPLRQSADFEGRLIEKPIGTAQLLKFLYKVNFVQNFAPKHLFSLH